MKFGAFGHYFISGGADRTTRLWSIEQSKPIRIFCGQSSDVKAIEFHPNCNYIISGSEDCSIVLYDFLTGASERHFVGHQYPISALKISSDGQMLASGDAGGVINIWDISTAKCIGKLNLTANVFFLIYNVCAQ